MCNHTQLFGFLAYQVHPCYSTVIISFLCMFSQVWGREVCQGAHGRGQLEGVSFSPDGFQSWKLSCQVWSQTPLPALLSHPASPYFPFKDWVHFKDATLYLFNHQQIYRCWFEILPVELRNHMVNVFKFVFDDPPYCFPQHLPFRVSTTVHTDLILHILTNTCLKTAILTGVYILLGGMGEGGQCWGLNSEP